MAVSLNSYVTDLTELALFTNYRVFCELCTMDADSTDPTSALSGARLDRAYKALNYGKQQVDAALRNMYTVPFCSQAISSTYPSDIVKQWTVKFALHFLYQLHADRDDKAAERLAAILAEIEPYIKPDGLELADDTRTAQPGPIISGGRNPAGRYTTQYDRAGQFTAEDIAAADGLPA